MAPWHVLLAVPGDGPQVPFLLEGKQHLVRKSPPSKPAALIAALKSR
jgi:hypothetical protein